MTLEVSCFESLESLLAFVFRQLETPKLSVDKISDYLGQANLTVTIPGEGAVPVQNLSRRQILSCLTNSDKFIRSGAPHSQTYAIRPNNPLLQCDGAIGGLIEQLLNEHGPMTIEELVSSSGLRDIDGSSFEHVLQVQDTDFVDLGGGRFWFANVPQPIRSEYESIEQAVAFALNGFRDGATIEDLRRFLCLATCNGDRITRKDVVRAVAAKPETFIKLQHTKYALVGTQAAMGLPTVPKRARAASSSPMQRRLLSEIQMEAEDDERPFNPAAFFGGSFSFMAE